MSLWLLGHFYVVSLGLACCAACRVISTECQFLGVDSSGWEVQSVEEVASER